jgi:apolipoprotein N-acyltransferase
MQSVPGRLKHFPSVILVVLSGILLGLNAPGNLQWVGFISLFPLLVVLDRIHRQTEIGYLKRLAQYLLACWTVGALTALLGVPWMTHSIIVFGHLPAAVAYAITSLIYGLEVGYLVFVCFALPLLFIKRTLHWDIPLRLMFLLAVETFLPQFFRWSFAGMTLVEEPWLSQAADLVGSPRLGFFTLGCSFLLLLLWRRYIELRPVSPRFLQPLVAGFIGITLATLAYGSWRLQDISQDENKGAKLHVVAVQPNFSLKHLASNKDLAYSNRQRNLSALITDSIRGLKQIPPDSAIPRLVVWPESSFPGPYFKRPQLRYRVENFARQYNTHVLLASIDWNQTAEGRRLNGISLLIGPDGAVKGRYNKIFLIPYGEYIPGADLFPAYADLLRENISNLSEFDAGTEFTVFRLSPQLPLSASICFDVFSENIVREMARNGAQLVVNLANLAWFGKTTATDQMEMAIRWHSIENRIPVLEVSNNGRSLLIDSMGNTSGKPIKLFEQGYRVMTLTLAPRFSLYRDYKTEVDLAFLLLLIVVGWLAQSRGCVFRPVEDGSE